MNCKKPSIFIQLILLVSCAIFIPLIILSVYFRQSTRNYMVDQLVSSRLKSLNQLDQNLSRITNELNAMIRHYDDSEEIEEKLTQVYEDKQQADMAEEELEAKLIQKVKDYGWVDSNLILIGRNHMVYSSSKNTPQLSTEVIYNSYWYQKNKNDVDNINYEIFNRSYFDPTDSSPNIVGIKPLVNKKTKAIYGIAILEVKESYFYNIYKDILEEGESLYLQTETGKVLSTSDRKVSLTLDPKDILLPPGHSSVQKSYFYQGKEYVYISKEAEFGIWDIVTLISLEKVKKEFNTSFRVFFLIIMATFVFAVIGILLIANQIHKPIHNLLYSLHQNSVHYAGSDSLLNPVLPTQLAEYKADRPKIVFHLQEYEELIEEVNQLIDKVFREQEARKDAEMKALSMQIRPHFLYNTLNSIKCLVWTQDYDKIEPMITNLVNLLKNSLDQGGQLISIEQEQENINLFINILNIRMNDKIELSWDIDPSLTQMKLPSFLLQPLVENSIFHGMDANKNKLQISIGAYREHDDIILEIIDNGIGMDAASLQNANSLIRQEKEDKQFSIGLRNVAQRLQWNYGKQATMQINSIADKGTVIRLKITGKNYENNDSRR